MAPDSGHRISLGEAARVWARIALLSFGGPAGQIAVMHRILVEEKKWIGEERFLHALNFCMLLPGPEAQQLATYIGWLLHKVKGGLIAGTLFILPGLLAIMGLSWLYVLYGNVGAVEAIFFGLKGAVLAIIVQAVIRIGGRSLGNPARLAVAAASFVAIFFLKVPFPLIVLGAGLTGFAAARMGSSAFAGGGGHGAAKSGVADSESALGTELPAHARPSWKATARIAAILLLLWLAPVLLLATSGAGVFEDIATFFSQMAVVTFGGAYAVLAYVAQAAVEEYRWLAPGEMLDGLGLAETTPGPLIMVTQFVGFLAAFRNPGELPPLLAATLGGLLTTWVTFLPCFLWIFTGAPFVERLRSNKALAGALAAITAAVVGVILNLALWFALHYLFGTVEERRAGMFVLDLPDLETLDWRALAITAAALVAALRFKLGVIPLILGCGVAGILLRSL